MSAGMRIGIVHYHLRTGGVTSVIETALRVLRDAGWRVAVLCGEPPAGTWPEVFADRIRVISGLRYGVTSCNTGELAAEMESAAADVLGGKPDLWHFHNHCLGKNSVLPLLVNRWADAGVPMVLQIHDFAEDGRPENYSMLRRELNDAPEPWLYPRARHVCYALLNSRDAGILRRAGIPPDCVSILPNAVFSPSTQRHRPPLEEPLALYPTRAIRRKNLGEFLLWAALAPSGWTFATTLEPLTPQARRTYDEWTHFSGACELPVRFGVGADPQVSFREWLERASLIVTTSVAEGFGLAFLEPWLAGRPLTGRNLPDITSDFRDAGIRLDNLYNELNVPLAWLDGTRLRKKMVRAYRRALAAYGRNPLPADESAVWDAACGGDGVDFGKLDEEFQRQVIEKVLSGAANKALQPSVLRAPLLDDPVIQANSKAISKFFGLSGYRRRLLELYRRAAAAEPSAVDRKAGSPILSQFLDPARFKLLRT